MNAASTGESYVTELLTLFDRQGPALFSGANSLCLTVPCLHYIQSQMTVVFGGVGGLQSDGHTLKVALPPNVDGTKNRAILRTLEERLGKVIALKLIPDKLTNPHVILNLAPFRSLQVLILKKLHLKSLSNLQLLRAQLKTLVVQRCQVDILDELLVTCGTDDATPIVWSSLKELDVSMNALRGLGQCMQYVPFLEKANFSNNVICDCLEGMEAIDKLEFLHLGFNQLKSIPRFAYRTRYHLKVFNLRNNCLERLDGLEELESLAELDLTDNLLCTLSVLKPLRALNHLHILQLAGNPIAQQEYRVKVAAYLSSMINKDIFALDGKRLSSVEQKAVPKEDVFGIVGTPSVPIPHSLQGTPVVPAALDTEPSLKPSSYPKVKRKHKKRVAREIQLDDDNTFESDVPLVYERSLELEETLRKQLQDNWLLSKMGVDLNGTAVHKDKKIETVHQETVQDDPKQIVDSGVSEVGDGALLELGETFMAEVYESDNEDQGGQRPGYLRGQQTGEEEKRVLLSFTERFFTERDLSAKQLDKMDLQSLTSAVIDRRLGKRNQQIPVLVLTFSSGRRDRRKREYVLLEDEEHQKAILNLLGPIIDENKGGVSITTKLECLKCCRVFDSSLAAKPPTEDKQPLPHLGSPYTRPRNLACPHCGSLILVEKGATPPAARSVGAMTSSPRKQSPPKYVPSPPKEPPTPLQRAPMATGSQVVNPGASIRVGFEPSRPDVIPVQLVPSPMAGGSRAQGSIEEKAWRVPVEPPAMATAQGSVSSLGAAQTGLTGPTGLPGPTGLTGSTGNANTGIERCDPSEAPPSTIELLSGAQAKQSADAPSNGTRMGPWEKPFRRQGSLQPDSPTHSVRSHAPIPEEESTFKTFVGETKNGLSPPQTKKVSSPSQTRRAPSPSQTRRAPSPSQTRRAPSPSQTRRAPSPSQTRRAPSPSQTRRAPSPSQTRRAPSPPQTRRAPSPSQTRRAPSPSQTRRAPSPSQTRRAPSPSQTMQPPILGSTVAKEMSQTGRGVVPMTSLSGDGPESSQRRSTNPFDSDDEGQQGGLPLGPEGSNNGTSPHNKGASPHVPSSRQRYTMGSLPPRRSAPAEHTPPRSHSPGPTSSTRVISTSLERSPVLGDRGDRGHSRSKSQDLRKGGDAPTPSDPFGDDVITAPPTKRTSWTGFSRRQKGASPNTTWHSSSDGPVGSRVPSPMDKQRQPSTDLQQSRYSVASDFISNIGRRKSKDEESTRVSATSPQSSTVPVSLHSTSGSSPYKKEDPTYVHNSFNLYLDMEVFTTEQGESFSMIFKSRVSQYNTGQEYDALFVASNHMAYIFRITGPTRSSPEKWLQLVAKIPLKNLVYIDIGVGYQSLRLEFDVPGGCYTFLMGDEEQCDRCATKLAVVVSDARNSSFKSIGVCPFSLQSIRDPEQFLLQEMKVPNGPTRSGDMSCDERLHLYLHTGHRLPGETVWSHVTLVVSTKYLFLGQENHDQWPMSKLQRPPEKASLRPPFSNVVYKEITDVEKLVRQSQRTITVHFFKENVSEGDLTDWRLHLHSHVGVDKLIAEVSRLWREEFQTDLEVVVPSELKTTPPA